MCKVRYSLELTIGMVTECSKEGDLRGRPQYFGPGDECALTHVQHLGEGRWGTRGCSTGRVYPGGR